MNRWPDLLTSFGLALLLHGLLVLGAVWFWTLRPPEIRPVFQGGDISLAVTFVAAGESRGAWSVEREAVAGEAREALSVERGAGEDASPKMMPDAGRQTPEDNLKKMPNNSLPAELSAEGEPLPEEEQDMFDAESAAPASANMPEDGRRTTRDAWQAADLSRVARDNGRQMTDSAPPSDALRQGVSGTVRRKSEIRPYYPLGARLRGEEGVVMVRVRVNSLGRALRCEVARSSGYPLLDEAAVDAARRARYVSTRPEALRAEAETTLTFKFQLTE